MPKGFMLYFCDVKYIRAFCANLWKIYVGIIFTFFAVLTFPVLRILMLSEKGRKRSFGFFIFWSWMIRFLCFYFVLKNKHPKLPAEQMIIIANHTSYLDIFLMYSILPKHKFVFLGKSEILKYPLIRTYFKDMNIPVFRNDRVKAAKSFVQAKKSLDKGWSLVIFPEGGIADENLPQLNSFKEGAFRLAKKSEVAILPITFLDNFHLFSDPTHIFGGAHPGLSRVIIHDLISVEIVRTSTVEELMNLSYDVINKPILHYYGNAEKK